MNKEDRYKKEYQKEYHLETPFDSDVDWPQLVHEDGTVLLSHVEGIINITHPMFGQRGYSDQHIWRENLMIGRWVEAVHNHSEIASKWLAVYRYNLYHINIPGSEGGLYHDTPIKVRLEAAMKAFSEAQSILAKEGNNIRSIRFATIKSSLYIDCPQCQWTYDVSGEASDQIIECDSCGTEIVPLWHKHK